jgi:hypothetical protein
MGSTSTWRRDLAPLIWPLVNLAIVLFWLFGGVIVLWLIYADPDPRGSLGSLFAYVAMMGAWSYVPYLAIVYVLPRSWSRRTRRVIAVALSPFVPFAAAGFAPQLILFGIPAGLTVILPERMGLRVARPDSLTEPISSN